MKSKCQAKQNKLDFSLDSNMSTGGRGERQRAAILKKEENNRFSLSLGGANYCGIKAKQV